jgi:hypothetical protein
MFPGPMKIERVLYTQFQPVMWRVKPFFYARLWVEVANAFDKASAL